MTTLNSLSMVGKYSFWIHDINGDNVINLTDAILGLQVLTGTSPDTVTEGADIDGNGTLGLEDIIIALKIMAE